MSFFLLGQFVIMTEISRKVGKNLELQKYSVLMSIYHKEKPQYFIDSVESMLAQTVMPDEIVIVKDGPLTGELDQLIKEYEAKYKNLFNIVPLEKNVGLGLALNEGLRACRNDLVARMDTDDIAKPERCELLLEAFDILPKLSIVGSNVDEFYDSPEDVVSVRAVPHRYEDILKFARKRNPFNHPSVMYRKKDVLTSGGYGDFRRNQDYELFVRMLNEGYYAINVSRSLLYFRANADNVKRRKSWDKCKGDILIRWDFWKKKYIGFSDFIIASSGFLFSFLAPTWLFELFSRKILRESK